MRSAVSISFRHSFRRSSLASRVIVPRFPLDLSRSNLEILDVHEHSITSASIKLQSLASGSSEQVGKQQQEDERGGRPPRLKDSLRKLFMLVHPDMLHGHPRERDINQRSFQLLQDYISAIRKSCIDGEPSVPSDFSAKQAYHFEFHIRKLSSSNLRESDQEGFFERVQVSLPPPQVQRGRGRLGLPTSTRLALGRLLSACGLLAEFSGGLSDHHRSEEEEERVLLSDLFQEALELQQQHQQLVSGGGQTETELRILQGVLRMKRGISVAFQGASLDKAHGLPLSRGAAASDSSRMFKVRALQTLVKALDRLSGSAVARFKLLLADHASGVDRLGRVWLDLQLHSLREQQRKGGSYSGLKEWDQEYWEGRLLDWSSQLKDLDMSHVWQRQAQATSRRVLEMRTARALEVDVVFADDLTGASEEYTEFLTALEAWAHDRGAVGQGKFFDLPVCITQRENTGDPQAVFGTAEPRSSQVGDTGCAGHRQGEGGIPEGAASTSGLGRPGSEYTGASAVPLRDDGFRLDQHTGTLAVPLGASPTQVYAFIEDMGQQAMQLRRRFKGEAARLASLTEHVRTKLKLRHLQHDSDTVSNEQFQSACLRMLRFAPELGRYSEGLSVCVSDESKIMVPLELEEGAPVLLIKWNFSPNDL